MRITESRLRQMIVSTIKETLIEDKRGKQAKTKSLQVIRDFFRDANWLDTEFVHQDNPKHLSHIDYILWQFEQEFYHDPNLRASAIMRLEPLFLPFGVGKRFPTGKP